MKKRILAASLLSSIVLAPALAGTPFTSLWEDYSVTVPDGWKAVSDADRTFYTNTFFKGPGTYSLSVRWHTRFATHRQVDELLEMYSDADDFMKQLARWYGEKDVVEPAHEITVGDKKMTRMTGRLRRIDTQSADSIAYYTLSRRARLGGALLGDEEMKKDGRQVWTVYPSVRDGGFYVFSYFAPEGNFDKYKDEYENMVASFVQLKDGPGGVPLPGVAAPAEAPEKKLNRYLTMLGSADPLSNASLLKELLEFTASMKDPPAIPDAARVSFIQGNTLLRAAKNASDYGPAIGKYREAVKAAPWWGDVYHNLGVALQAAEQYEDAKKALEIYRLTNPEDADEARTRSLEIDALLGLQKEREAKMRARYGGGSGSTFDWSYLFRYGAVVQSMTFDASGNERAISLKIVTRKEGGSLRNYFQIADITSSSDTFLRKFSMDWRGTDTFYLDDRSAPFKELITFSVAAYGDGDANITLRPAENASASIQTTLASLLKERASQAVYAGERLIVGERDFYVVGQGGAVGSLLFFPAEIKGKLENGSVYDLMPMLVANVNYRRADGSNGSYDNADLGLVDGQPYHLEHNGRFWAAKPGRGENH